MLDIRNAIPEICFLHELQKNQFPRYNLQISADNYYELTSKSLISFRRSFILLYV